METQTQISTEQETYINPETQVKVEHVAAVSVRHLVAAPRMENGRMPTMVEMAKLRPPKKF